uniref:Uncharacterized protein n=1 Tax=Vespula pensylvanica TaxID=30213 RepID=A0A834KS73_VESPE|nr:hypothetical protein H0235_012945 [Vespula pensylvanica]
MFYQTHDTMGERSSTNRKDVRQALQTNSEREEAVSRSGGTVFMVMNLLANNDRALYLLTLRALWLKEELKDDDL